MNFNPFGKIQELFEKRGIKSETDLNELERAEYDLLTAEAKRLVEEDFTAENMRSFCDSEKKRIEREWHNNPDNSNNKDTYLKALHVVYSTFIGMIDAPKAEKEQFIKKLDELIKK
jgi:hypothetical protein